MIKLTIEKKVKNEKFEEQVKLIKEERKNNYGYSNNLEKPYPEEYTVEGALKVEITEAQFEAIRKEVLKVF